MAILIASLERSEARSNGKENVRYTQCDLCEEKWSQYYEEYFGLKMVEDKSVTAYFSKVIKLAAEIENQGESLSDNMKMSRIISNLHPRFQNFKTV